MKKLIICKSKKLLHENFKLQQRVKQLEEILCPCEQHDYVIADVETTYPFTGGQSVEVMHKRKLICRKCKNIIYDFDGCGHSYRYQVTKHD